MSDEPDRILWRCELQAELGKSSETIRMWIKTGKLPPPDLPMSRKSMGWRLSTLRAAGINLPTQRPASQPTPESLAA